MRYVVNTCVVFGSKNLLWDKTVMSYLVMLFEFGTTLVLIYVGLGAPWQLHINGNLSTNIDK